MSREEKTKAQNYFLFLYNNCLILMPIFCANWYNRLPLVKFISYLQSYPQSYPQVPWITFEPLKRRNIFYLEIMNA